jgi:hypothetical protein
MASCLEEGPRFAATKEKKRKKERAPVEWKARTGYIVSKIHKLVKKKHFTLSLFLFPLALEKI